MTMGLLDNVKLRVRKASPQARTALVSECAERVYPIYEEMWWGSFYVAVRRAIGDRRHAELLGRSPMRLQISRYPRQPMIGRPANRASVVG